jgi:rod shape-determining protein MreD
VNRFIFIVSTLVLGFVVHMAAHRYLSVFNIGPDILLLLVLANAFSQGPLMGEIMGFCWGLMADCLGVSFFGLQSFLFSAIGYFAGHLRRRIDTERPIPQVVVALLGTVVYSLGSTLIRSVLEQAGQRISLPLFLLQCAYNAALAIPVFWIMTGWIYMLRMNYDQS